MGPNGPNLSGLTELSRTYPDISGHITDIYGSLDVGSD